VETTTRQLERALALDGVHATAADAASSRSGKSGQAAAPRSDALIAAVDGACTSRR
jgi:hypothetical protein